MDVLALLVILMAIVMITWITITYMEIETMKITVNGYKKKNEVIQPVTRLDTILDQIIQPELWYIPKLERDKIYYLSHPCTTGGRSIKENKKREEALYKRIVYENPGIKVIRPLKIIPEGMQHEEAMDRCYKLLDTSDVIILPDMAENNWQSSSGCRQEFMRASVRGMAKVFIDER